MRAPPSWNKVISDTFQALWEVCLHQLPSGTRPGGVGCREGDRLEWIRVRTLSSEDRNRDERKRGTEGREEWGSTSFLEILEWEQSERRLLKRNCCPCRSVAFQILCTKTHSKSHVLHDNPGRRRMYTVVWLKQKFPKQHLSSPSVDVCYVLFGSVLNSTDYIGFTTS